MIAKILLREHDKLRRQTGIDQHHFLWDLCPNSPDHNQLNRTKTPIQCGRDVLIPNLNYCPESE